MSATRNNRTVSNYRGRIWAKRPARTTNGWEERHDREIMAGSTMGQLVSRWLEYADTHKERFDSGIGEDYVLGPAWAQLGVSLRVLLNGELGNLDAGTLDGALVTTLADEGFSEDGGRI